MIALLLLILIGGCASVPHKDLDPKVYYKRSLRIRVNGGDKIHGAQVVDYEEKYKIEVKSPDAGDVVILKSCHRETLSEDEGKRYKFNYVPSIGIEIGNGINCPLVISHMNVKGRHSWGMVFFRDENLDNKLIANLKCNGNESLSKDKSVCQSKQGLEQEISFSKKVKFNCDEFKMKTNDNMTFRFESPNRLKQCLFYTDKETHILVSIGYEQVLLRSK